MKTTHLRIASHIPRTFAELVSYTQTIVTKMTGNRHFPSPTPALAQVKADVAALVDAEATVKTTKGATHARDAKAQAVIHDVHGLEAYVQSVADANPQQAAEIIESAGFATAEHGVHEHAPLTAKMGPGGIVVLRAMAAVARAVYEWQWSADGGKTWTAVPATSHAHTTIPDLAVGTTYEFRVRANHGDVVGDWSQSVSLLVH